MESNTNGTNDNIIRPNKDVVNSNTVVNNNSAVNNNTNDIQYQNNPNGPLTGDTLPYQDPAITNPEELASFPTPAEIVDAHEVANESENRLVNTRSPLREGRNIIQTDNAPGDDGFI